MTGRWRALLLALWLAGCAAAPVAGQPGPTGAPIGPWRDQIHKVPIIDKTGQIRLLHTRICRPPGDAPAPVVLIAHGSPVTATDRPGFRPAACAGEAVTWFLKRGYIVVLGLRRGFGETGGRFDEAVGNDCSAENYVASAKESARDLDALTAYATALPFARNEGVVVVGQSAGGWAAVGYNAIPHPRVRAMVSMAGGRGGRVNNVPNVVCRADELARAAGILGATATTRMLWVYTANDSFFSPSVAASMHAAFGQAGGKAELLQLDAFGADGHGLFFARGGSAIWGGPMERYLAAQSAN